MSEELDQEENTPDPSPSLEDPYVDEDKPPQESQSPAKKKKKVGFLIKISLLVILTSLIVYVFYPSLNVYLFLNVFPLASSTANSIGSYGENIDMSQILPTSQHYIVNSKGQDLIDIAANLGINLIRITNGERSFDNNADSIYTEEQWNQVLDKMQSKGIKALIQIETASDNGDYYTPDIRPIYLYLVQEYIDSGVFSNPDIYAVDIKNEPVLTNANLNMLQAAHRMIKEKYPNLKQTVGWWATPTSTKHPYKNYSWVDYSTGQKLANIVDFYSLHMYGLATPAWGISLDPDLKTKLFLSQVENSLRTNKPLLIEEFGEANGDAVSDQGTIGSPQLQAKVYQGVYQALKEMHSNQIIGAVAFEFYSRNQYPDAWALAKNRGDYLYPAAYILQEFALGKNNPSLQAATVVTSESYLATNADKYTVKNLHLSDRVGLKLRLNDSKEYSLSLSVQGILQPREFFYYDPGSYSYYAVYQAVGRGSVELSVTPTSYATSYAAPIYTLTINVR